MLPSKKMELDEFSGTEPSVTVEGDEEIARGAIGNEDNDKVTDMEAKVETEGF